MQANDIINGSFEIFGGILCWVNVRKILRDKHVAGISWGVQLFFCVWGFWNLYYYPTLSQWCSFVGGVFLVLAYTIWTALAIYYTRKNRAFYNGLS